MPALPQSNIHLDILMGRDESLGVSDFFGGGYLLSLLDPVPCSPKSRKVWRVNHRWTSTVIWKSYGCNIEKEAPVLPDPWASTLAVLCRRYKHGRRSQLVLRVYCPGPTAYVMQVIAHVRRKHIVPFARRSRAQCQTPFAVIVDIGGDRIR